MTTATAPGTRESQKSADARRRFEAAEGGPFLVADWKHAAFIHYRVPPDVLRPTALGPGAVELDLYEGWAYVSLVALEFHRPRMNTGGRIVDWLGQTGAARRFLGARTYVKHPDHPDAPGVLYLAGWLDGPSPEAVVGAGTVSGLNPGLNPGVPGQGAYGLAFHAGRVDSRHDSVRGDIEGWASNSKPETQLHYTAVLSAAAKHGAYRPSAPGSLDEFLLERYTVFTHVEGIERLFRMWHQPWPQAAADAQMRDDGLLTCTGHWLTQGEPAAAHVSPGVSDVWIGRPTCINGPACAHPWPGWER